MPKDKPRRWRKKDKRLPNGYRYFSVLDGEIKEQSYQRCWAEWLAVRAELDRQAVSIRNVKAQTTLHSDVLDELQELTLPLGEKNFAIRTPPVGDAGRAIQAVGVALGPSVRFI